MGKCNKALAHIFLIQRKFLNGIRDAIFKVGFRHEVGDFFD